MQVNRKIFREYDIRAIYEEDLKGDLPYFLGKSFGSIVRRQGGKNLCIAGDNRLTTPVMKDKLLKGIIETGCNIVDIGITPTPVLYFTLQKGGFDAGAVVTASHNPPEFNGLKMVIDNKSLHGKEIQQLADLIENNDFERGTGKIERRDVTEDYVSFMLNKFKFEKPLKVGIDTGNGTLGPLIVPLFQKMGIEIYPLYTESDPSFPNHLPDPLVPENLEDLIKAVIDNNLDIGFGYDGDGDRLAAIDDKGNILWGDRLLILYAREVLKKMPGSSIIFDVKCSKSLEEEIQKAGGNPVMWKTGRSLIENKLFSEKAPLAGELSGHLFFTDEYFGFDDAVYASLRLLRIMEKTGQKLSALLSDVKKYYSTPEIRIDVPDEKKFGVIAELKKFFTETQDRFSDIDGVKVFFPDGWALVRASNTQPALVLRIEADSESSLKKIKEDFLGTVAKFI